MSEPKQMEIPREMDASGLRFGCVVSRFNSYVTERLLEGTLEGLRQHGGDLANVTVAEVPGSLELATVAMAMAKSGRYDAVICLGAVIKGETDHYEHVSAGAVSSIGRIGPETGVPAVFGVLTCRNRQHAMDRSGGRKGNAGLHAAETAIEMAHLMRNLRVDQP